VDAKYFPYQGEKVVEIIRQVTDKPIRFLVYTHGHGDHTQGAQSFPASTVIIAHHNTLKQMEKDGAARIEREKSNIFPRQLKALEEKVEKLRADQSPKLNEAEKELEFKRFQILDYERLKLIFPEIAFDKTATIRLGGIRVELIYLGSGHTEGDILVYFPKEKAICTGDLFSRPGEEKESMRNPDMMKQLEKMEPVQIKNMAQSIENVVKILEKTMAMDFEIAIPGHGNLSDKEGMQIQIEYAKQLVRDLLSRDRERSE